jgi:lipopolysaccharide/colanic/teichoic acid biosynthesis glycosyltransferase
MLKASDDRRIKRIGGFICRQSLTDLPQLFNLRRGVLSLVGPRPLISDEHRHVEDSGEMSLGGPRPLILEEDSFVANWGRRRLDLRPGITGTWQVSGRTEIRFEEMVRLDYLYATSWSPWNDVRLILRTLPIVVRGGAG